MGKRTHEPGKLSALSLKRLTDGWHGDGGNLYLFVRGPSRTWVFRYTSPDGRRRNMGLGSLDAVTLADARRRAVEIRSKLKSTEDPVDPIAERQAKQTALRAEGRRQLPFKDAVTAFLKDKESDWKNTKHAAQWKNTLETYANPVIGDIGVGHIGIDHILAVLQPIWQTKNETASRLRGRIESVLAWATVKKHRQGDNPAVWRNNLDKVLTAPAKVQTVKHHASLPYEGLPDFMAALRNKDDVAPQALQFLIYTAARTGEVIQATWDEINFDKKLWSIPAARMKAKRAHTVPLTDTAIAILKKMQTAQTSAYIFPGPSGDKPLSTGGMERVLDRMGVKVTVHGFRSTFRTWAAEQTTFPPAVCEMALAHDLRTDVEASYQRSDLLDKRRKLMTTWERFALLGPAKVVALKKGRRAAA
jgi:integrase